MNNYIWITTQKEMFHKYPGAPDEVAFLRNLHRHIFKFKVYISVTHNDRDIEFIMFKRKVDEYINRMADDQKSRSCEMISDALNNAIVKDYPGRKVKIEVSEDGENGSYKKYDGPVNEI